MPNSTPFSPRTFPGAGHLTIVRKYFDEIAKGEKSIEYRETSKTVDNICSKPYLVLKNGRAGKCPYLVVRVKGSMKASTADVEAAHGKEALQYFKSSEITGIQLGEVVEIFDPKTNTYFRDASHPVLPNLKKTTTPTKHAARDGSAGPLPIDMHVRNLQRRNLAECPKQTLYQAFEGLFFFIPEAHDMVKSARTEGHRPLLMEDVALKVGSRFSGLGTCEEALKILEPFVSAQFSFQYACDVDDDAFKFHTKRFSPQHFFGDIHGLIEGKVADDLFQQSFANKLKAIQSISLDRKAWCKRHKKKCTIPFVDLDFSGSVCKDYSAQGKKAGTEGRHVLTMLAHFEDLKQRKVPIRVSENVVSAEGQAAIASTMSDCEVKYIITMPEDVGMGCVRRDRGWLIGVAPPYRFFMDPNEAYRRMAEVLAAKQVPQHELWFDDDAGLRAEREMMATSLRPFDPEGSLCLGCVVVRVICSVPLCCQDSSAKQHFYFL
eukprot:Skav207861  [mRNA]  locus=scaffold1988:82733:84202:- [translate_table: standard]